jgi:uncharacterized phage-associated protein
MNKFKQVLHYIIHEYGGLPNVGKTVLFKILYFSDFDNYEIYEKSITEETYAKLPFGPAPRHFDKTIKELEKENKIIHVPTKKEYENNRFISEKEPELSLLSAQEKEVIDKTAKKLANMTASQVSELSHEDAPYKAAKNNDNLDYELVFYRSKALSVRNYDI